MSASCEEVGVQWRTPLRYEKADKECHHTGRLEYKSHERAGLGAGRRRSPEGSLDVCHLSQRWVPRQGTASQGCNAHGVLLG